MSHILIVDDEASLRETIQKTLHQGGHTTTLCCHGKEAVTAMGKTTFDLVILDISMPEMDGYDVCNWMMAHQIATPILMLSSKDSEMDKALGLNLGADDYVTKPFSPTELLARVKARLRKKIPLPAEIIQLGQARLDKFQQRFWIGEREINLSTTEFHILSLFLAQPGRVYTREVLLDSLNSHEVAVQPHAVDNHMYRLRLKLRAVPDADIEIQTVRQSGYRVVVKLMR